MKASRNSFHAGLYNFTYKSQLPKSLCPYFWKLLLALILGLPNFILQFPALVYNLFTKRENDNAYYYSGNMCNHRRNAGFKAYSWMMGISLYLLATVHMFKMMFHCYSYNQELAKVGIFFNSIVVLLIIACICFFIYEKFYENRIRTYERKPSIVKEFIKAKYGKYCPKIDWE